MKKGWVNNRLRNPDPAVSIIGTATFGMRSHVHKTVRCSFSLGWNHSLLSMGWFKLLLHCATPKLASRAQRSSLQLGRSDCQKWHQSSRHSSTANRDKNNRSTSEDNNKIKADYQKKKLQTWEKNIGRISKFKVHKQNDAAMFGDWEVRQRRSLKCRECSIYISDLSHMMHYDAAVS